MQTATKKRLKSEFRIIIIIIDQKLQNYGRIKNGLISMVSPSFVIDMVLVASVTYVTASHHLQEWDTT